MEAGIGNLSMFLLGLTGSGHCLGMCGPLVIALPGRYGRWQAHWVYHAGRLATYTLVGAVLGAMGRGMVQLFDLAPGEALIWTGRVQVAVSVPVALLMLFLGLNRLGLLDEPRWLAMAAPQRIPGYGSVMQRVLNRNGAGWLFVMGMMMGLLPCGLSYGAFARTLAAEGMGRGAILAACFGVGTLPCLLLLGTGAGVFWRRYRAQMEMLAGLIMIGMAVALTADVWTAVF